jgi:hypothetical protein
MPPKQRRRLAKQRKSAKKGLEGLTGRRTFGQQALEDSTIKRKGPGRTPAQIRVEIRKKRAAKKKAKK